MLRSVATAGELKEIICFNHEYHESNKLNKCLLLTFVVKDKAPVFGAGAICCKTVVRDTKGL